jgi:hypothetical protein
MNDYTYNNKEIELIKYIINYPPLRVWNDFVSYVFEYESKYIGIYCAARQAASQNKFDEAIIATIYATDGAFVPTEYMEKVFEGKQISEAYIVRSFLYFTDYTRYSNTGIFFRRLKYILKKIFLFKADPVEKITLKTVGVHEEISCNPDSVEAKSVDSQYANLIDKGLLLKINDIYLPTYINMNSYGFHVVDKKFFYTLDELEDDFKIAKLIKVE